MKESEVMFSKIIQHALVDKGMKKSDLARTLNTSYQNLDQKIKRDNFSEREMLEIAEALNHDLKISLNPRK